MIMKRLVCMFFLLLATLVIGNTASAKILSSSKTKVTVQKGSKACVIVTFKKDGMVYYQNMNSKIATAKWGKSEDGRIKLYIKGKKVGQSKILITNSKNKEKVVIRVKVKKKYVLNPNARKLLKIPKNATYTAEEYKFFWSGGAMHLYHIEVKGTGKYKGYSAYGDLSTDYKSGKSIYHWSRTD